MTTEASPDPLRVLHVTDPHLFADAASSLRGTVTDESLSAVLAHYQRSGWTADLIAMTGDVIQDDTAAAYDRFILHFASLGLPVHCVPGNHDVRSFMREALASPPFCYCASVQIGNWLLTGIDSCLENEAGGHISDEELGRLEAILAATTAEHIAICLHHPPLPMGSKWLDQVGLRNAKEFLNLLTHSGKVRATFFGHVHQAVDQRHESIDIIGTPSTCRQFKPGSDDFALDEQPPAYRRIELSADGHVDSELIWVTGDQ